MTKEQYIKITNPLRMDEKKAKKLINLNQILTGLVFLIYPLHIVMLYLGKEAILFKTVLVPAVSFVFVTILRRIINAPRPYEKFGIPPVLEKDTQGKSFPSRHVFSVFIIAVTIFYVYPGPGILIGLIGAAMAVTRVAGGVHEPRDVIAGAMIGIACGVIGFYLIP